MNAGLTPDEQSRLNAVLRPGETVLWQGKGNSVSVAAPAGFLARLFRKAEPTSACALYAITAKRVIALPPHGSMQEWFLMLGLIQAVEERTGGCGDIIFDFEEIDGHKVPRGLINIPAVGLVRNLLSDAIDAAYNASPWSV